MGQGVIDLKEIAAILAKHQPALTLSVEVCSFQRFEIPFFDDAWWDGFPRLHAKHAAKFTRFLHERLTEDATNWRTPVEEEWPDDRLLAHEEKLVRDAVAYTRSSFLPVAR